MLRQLIVFIFLLFLSYGIAHPREITEGDVSAIIEKAREDEQKMTIPVNKYAEEGLKAAKQAADHVNSPEVQEQIQCEQQRLEEEVFGEYVEPWRTQLASSKAEQRSDQVSHEKIYLFFSSSVPDETIHAYIAAIARVKVPNIIPMMRGFVGGMAGVKATTTYFSRIMRKDFFCKDQRNPQSICPRYQVSVQLGSPLFEEFGITRVPAVVYVNDDVQKSFVIEGDAGLDYLLERINREAKSPSLNQLITRIRSRQ